MVVVEVLEARGVAHLVVDGKETEPVFMDDATAYEAADNLVHACRARGIEARANGPALLVSARSVDAVCENGVMEVTGQY